MENIDKNLRHKNLFIKWKTAFKIHCVEAFAVADEVKLVNKKAF